jgi:hypothetical protein
MLRRQKATAALYWLTDNNSNRLVSEPFLSSLFLTNDDQRLLSSLEKIKTKLNSQVKNVRVIFLHSFDRPFSVERAFI